MTGTPEPSTKPKKEKSSNIPVQLECSLPGKTRWLIWKTEFEIDDRYVPIKVCIFFSLSKACECFRLSQLPG